jgi:SAM-dependent methyltransferase
MKRLEKKTMNTWKKLPPRMKLLLKKNQSFLFKCYFIFFTPLGKSLNRINLLKNKNKKLRKLEIGPGFKRISGFETLNIFGGLNVDYVYDASRKLPFRSNTFEVIYASHILEHIPWYKTKKVIKEWVRTLKPGGSLEIWVPDGLKICKAFIDYELNQKNIKTDNWYKFNSNRNPCIWANSRIFSYGDGSNNRGHPNWHKSLLSYRYICDVFYECGLEKISKMSKSEIRGYDHGWINLGVRGIKK